MKILYFESKLPKKISGVYKGSNFTLTLSSPPAVRMLADEMTFSLAFNFEYGLSKCAVRTVGRLTSVEIPAQGNLQKSVVSTLALKEVTIDNDLLRSLEQEIRNALNQYFPAQYTLYPGEIFKKSAQFELSDWDLAVQDPALKWKIETGMMKLIFTSSVTNAPMFLVQFGTNDGSSINLISRINCTLGGFNIYSLSGSKIFSASAGQLKKNETLQMPIGQSLSYGVYFVYMVVRTPQTFYVRKFKLALPVHTGNSWAPAQKSIN